MTKRSLFLLAGSFALALMACGPENRPRDAGPVGIDANLPPTDAYVAACTTTGPENTVAACSDGCDNDGDRFADCDDYDCCSLVTCGGDTACGRRSDAGPPVDAAVLACATTGPENTVAACSDGCDNDGDRFADCNDYDCCSLVTCGSDTACGRRSDAGPRADAYVPACSTTGPENTTAACSDGCDNDGDRFADCDDFDCCSVVSCGSDTSCGRRSDAGPPVDAAVLACATTGPENTVAACSDGCDNDGDRFADCNDYDCCSLVTCGSDTACGRRSDAGPRADAYVPACSTTGPENTTAACSDGCDNDGDHFADCDDFDCCSVVSCGATTACGRRDAGR